MKKYLFLALIPLLFAACDNDSDIVDNPVKMEKLTGEWVYDSPKDTLWEVITFTSSGVFYYSNDWAT